MRESDRLFDTLDDYKEGTINLRDFTSLVSANAQEIGADSAPFAEGADLAPPLPPPLSQPLDDLDQRSGREIQRSKSDRKVTMAQTEESFNAVPDLPQPKRLQQYELERIFKTVAEMASIKAVKPNTATAYKKVQAMSNEETPEGIDRTALVEFMKHHGYDDGVANQVFDWLDKDGSGHLDYQ